MVVRIANEEQYISKAFMILFKADEKIYVLSDRQDCCFKDAINYGIF